MYWNGLKPMAYGILLFFPMLDFCKGIDSEVHDSCHPKHLNLNLDVPLGRSLKPMKLLGLTAFEDLVSLSQGRRSKSLSKAVSELNRLMLFSNARVYLFVVGLCDVTKLTKRLTAMAERCVHTPFDFDPLIL